MCTKANQKFFTLRKLKESGFSSQELVTIYKGYYETCVRVCSSSLAPRPYYSETGGPGGGEHPKTCQQAYPRLGVYINPDSLAELELESLEDHRLHHGVVYEEDTYRKKFFFTCQPR